MKRIIYDYLTSLDIPNLGSYYGEPAVFEQQAPDDREWEGKQYGRILYDLFVKDDPERKVSGSLQIMAAYQNTDEGEGHDNLITAEKTIQESFDGTFFSTDELTIATAWNRTEPFTESIDNQNDTDVFGVILYFDVYAFPVMEHGIMDPVKSLALYIQEKIPEAKLINFGQMEKVWRPSDGALAVYVRLENIIPGAFRSNHACTWLSASMKAHFISDDDKMANNLSIDLITDLSEKERFPMWDGSPCFVQRVQFNQFLDVLKDGRIMIQGQYGVLRKEEETELLQKITVNSES